MNELRQWMQIIEATRSMPGAKGGWWSPTGQLFHLPGSVSHERWIESRFREAYPDGFDTALRAGWVRITYPIHQSDGFSFNGEIAANVAAAVRAFLSELRGHRVDIDLTGEGWKTFGASSSTADIMRWLNDSAT